VHLTMRPGYSHFGSYSKVPLIGVRPSRHSRMSCPLRLSRLTDEKGAHNTMVRHSSIPPSETRAKIT